MSIELLNIDCMEYMATLPDKDFDLAIVDPPYGLGEKITNGGTWAAKLGSEKRTGSNKRDTHLVVLSVRRFGLAHAVHQSPGSNHAAVTANLLVVSTTPPF